MGDCQWLTSVLDSGMQEVHHARRYSGYDLLCQIAIIHGFAKIYPGTI